jgi:hypothetical protein
MTANSQHGVMYAVITRLDKLGGIERYGRGPAQNPTIPAPCDPKSAKKDAPAD